MHFEVGETVVYPHHGAAKIIAVKQRTLGGREQTFLTLQVDEDDLTIEVPAANCELVGVRDVIDSAGLEEVLEVLRSPGEDEHSLWSRRYKANIEKLATGDVIKVAEVVRDLWRRDRHIRALSNGEKRILAKARQILVSEVALAQRSSETAADSTVEAALASYAAPDPGSPILPGTAPDPAG